MDFEEFTVKYQKVQVEYYPHQVKEKPLVSVCVQTYQHVNFIKECLDGILMQETNFDFEILLGEDASTDGTREICIEYAEKYPDKIKLFLHHRENNISIGGSPTGRFNFVYNLFSAKGKYIALCEGDDYWTDQNKLQKQVDFLEENEGFVASFHQTQQLFEGHNSTKGKTYGKYTGVTCFSTIDTITTLSPWHTSSFLFKNIIKVFPQWFMDVSSVDMALFSMMSKYGYIYGLPRIMSVYRKNEGGVSNTKAHKANQYHQNRIMLMKLLKSFHDNQFEDQFEEVINYHKSKVKNEVSLLIEKKYNKLKLIISKLWRS